MQAMSVNLPQVGSIKNICVIGAGVMGQGIVAHMINAGVSCTLLDVKSSGDDPNKIVKAALKKIRESKPSLLFVESSIDRIKIGNIEDDLSIIKDCDLVVEAVVEKLDIKVSLFKKIEEHLGAQTIIASNTSGLSIKKMLASLNQDFCERFLVMHFFNPVRYLHLLEIIPSLQTKKEYINTIVKFGEERLGKGVVVGKDTPNFIANRIGVYGMMETINAILHDGYRIEEIDAIFGPALGRPKSAVFRTADIVGLDTFIHVAKNCHENLKDDECRKIFAIPDFLQEMVKKGFLGQKVGQGFYKKVDDKIFVIDPKTLTYHEKNKARFESIAAVKNINSLKEKIYNVAYSDDRAGRLFFNLAAKICIYSANRLGEIADNIVDIDNALKWGFNWEMGPFETWDALGVRKSVDLIKAQGFTVPQWVLSMLNSGRETFYKHEDGKTYYYCPHSNDQYEIKLKNRELKINWLKKHENRVIEDSDGYSLIDSGKGALIVEFHSKMNAIDPEILQGINHAIDRCENGEFLALVLANDGANFSVGANLFLLYMAASQGMWKEIEDIIVLFQNTAKRLRYCSVPTVAAPFQLTLGGGCELSLWCDRIHAHAETYIGLVEVAVGLIPGGGGNVEMIARALHGAPNNPTFVTETLLMRALETVAMAKVATSALMGKELLYLKEADSVSMNRRYLLHDAMNIAVSMATSSYMPPAARAFRLPGKNAYATFDMGLRAFLDGKFISQHDYFIAKKIAHVMTGGDTNSYQEITEDKLLDLEREAFLSLCGEPKTMERIAYMLEHNKPLRN
jgi:3-hydroxyacyl-CoA dehydrogenase